MPTRALTHRRDEAAFTEFVTANRPLLQGVAYLLVGDVSRTEELVQVTLAQLYRSWPSADDALVAALQRLLATDPARLDPPWQQRSRVELLDTSTVALPTPDGIVADLADLEGDARRALVLERYAKLTPEQAAAVLSRNGAEIARLARQAWLRLAATDPERIDEAVLDAQLVEAVPYVLRTSPLSALDVTHGRRLLRQQRLHRAAVVGAVLLLVALGAAIWIPRSNPSSAGISPPTAPAAPTPSRLRPPACGTLDQDCRTRTVAAWRDQMASVVRSYLDPGQTYFTSVSYRPNSRYESPGFWTGEGGLLGVDLVPRDGGATFVYLQIATDGKFAIPCGDLTAQHCGSVEFLDGNRFTMTDSTTTRSGGIEVQYWLDEVITVAAFDVGEGRPLEIRSGDLIKLVQDQRLHLPHA
jgi:DNA-directed RNA polymerase specialized sigma24 family protein